MARLTCFRLLTHAVRLAVSLARPSAGSKSAARMAMMAMTNSNSMSVKPRFAFISTGHRSPRSSCQVPFPAPKSERLRLVTGNGLAGFSLFLHVHAIFAGVFPLVTNLLHHLDIIADIWMARIGLDP